MKRRSLLLFWVVLFFGLVGSTIRAKSPDKSVLMQGFGWNSSNRGSPGKWYTLIGDRAKSMAEMGITHIWFPPVSRSVSPQGYLPGDYYDLGTEKWPTFYGDLAQLKGTLKKLQVHNIKALADVVVNHRCAGKQDPNGVWNVYHFPSGKAKWESWAICKGEYGGTGTEDTGEDYHAAPDIDHLNPTVRKDIIEWMRWLKTLGFEGWRYDFVKGFGAKFVGMYDKATNPAFSIGEIWTNMSYSGSSINYDQNPHRQQLCNWLDQAGSEARVFDFTTKGILQVAVNGEYWRLKDKEGKASGLIGWWPLRAVTFIDNHDTGSQQSHWPFPSDKVMQGYAYVLTHPGVPCLFWEHVYDWNLRDRIKKIIEVRRKYGIHAESKLVVDRAEKDLYSAYVDGKVAVKLGKREWSPGEAWTLQTDGDGFAIWGKNSGTSPSTRRR